MWSSFSNYMNFSYVYIKIIQLTLFLRIYSCTFLSTSSKFLRVSFPCYKNLRNFYKLTPTKKKKKTYSTCRDFSAIFCNLLTRIQQRRAQKQGTFVPARLIYAVYTELGRRTQTLTSRESVGDKREMHKVWSWIIYRTIMLQVTKLLYLCMIRQGPASCDDGWKYTRKIFYITWQAISTNYFIK